MKIDRVECTVAVPERHRADAHQSFDTESGIPPIDRAVGDLSTYYFLREDLDDRSAKVLRHSVKIPEGDIIYRFHRSRLPKG